MGRKEISACMVCGSTRVSRFLKYPLSSGEVAEPMYTCENCGNYGTPVIFNSDEDYNNFLEEISKDEGRIERLSKSIWLADKKKNKKGDTHV